MAATATLNTKVEPYDKERFSRTAESLGMSASTALKVFVLKFNECGGFSFEQCRVKNSLIRSNILSFCFRNRVLGLNVKY